MQNAKPMDIILASPLENIAESFKGMTLGELKSFTNALRMMYQTQKATKEKILERAMKGELDINDLKVRETVDGLYASMTKLESIILVGTEVEKTKVIVE